MLRINLYPIYFNLYFFKKGTPSQVFFQHLSEHILMVASVNKTLEDEIHNDTVFIFQSQFKSRLFGLHIFFAFLRK